MKPFSHGHCLFPQRSGLQNDCYYKCGTLWLEGTLCIMIRAVIINHFVYLTLNRPIHVDRDNFIEPSLILTMKMNVGRIKCHTFHL